MPFILIYILKLSISLAVVCLFYHLVLRKLTFYNSNRWYLIGYTVLSFLIPFINITPVLNNNRFSGNELIRFIPSVEKYTTQDITVVTASPAQYGMGDWILAVLITGAAIFLLRFIIRCTSFLNMKRKARLISGDGMNLYQVNAHIIPFSFGNSVFINSELHTEEELQEIIRHEFVHVKQRHTLDIIWSEWLCIINWYNPFAWLLKASIRQNLEFIADNKVLENGVDKKTISIPVAESDRQQSIQYSP
ncbi:MAG: M56 family metallopeptidase [Bacteroidota bacterium]